MYQPQAFREGSLQAQHDLIEENPLGLLVSTSETGLIADPIPFVIDPTAGEFGTLRAHLAKANPQYRALASAGECLVVFQASDAYITPEWYETKRETGKVVPTWNYVTVHVYGRPRLVEDPAWLYAQLSALTDLMEGNRPKPWSIKDAPSDFIRSQAQGIFGVEVEIARMEGKWKVSQNRSSADQRGVIEGLRSEGQSEMADVVESRRRP
jgi:transcriptional regulator